MSQETQTLLAGALIALFSSLVTILVNDSLKRKSEDRARKWELEDRQVKQRIEIVGARLREAREFVDALYQAADKLMLSGIDGY
jgi:hypothetical protein